MIAINVIEKIHWLLDSIAPIKTIEETIETVYDNIDEDAAKQWKQLYPDVYDSLDVRDES